jgi:hypothetical protein
MRCVFSRLVSDCEHDSSATGVASPGRHNFAQRNGFDIDARVAFGGEIEQTRDGIHYPLKRYRTESAAEDAQIDAAERGSAHGDGFACAFAHFDRTSGTREIRTKPLGKGVKN